MLITKCGKIKGLLVLLKRTCIIMDELNARFAQDMTKIRIRTLSGKPGK